MYFFARLYFRSKEEEEEDHMSSNNDIHEEQQLLSQRLQTLTTEEIHSLDLQLTLLRTAFESYKRETVFKPCPPCLLGLTDDQLVS